MMAVEDPIPAGQGRIFNIQRYSLQDGPGLRTTVFMKGCPLACAWCHNPESQSVPRRLVTHENRCMGCGTCGDLFIRGKAPAPEELVEACPTGAKQLMGRDVEVGELVEEVLKDRLFFDESGGGVTFSGGEPLMQSAFVVKALSALRDKGVHTALDTCGLAPRNELLEAAALAQVVLFDLKHMDDDQHRAWTGAGNATILANLQALSLVHANIWIRMPVVPEVNDDLKNLEATAAFVAKLPGVHRLDLLPYHTIGAAKFRRLGRQYILDHVLPPSPKRMAEVAKLFRGHGLTVAIGGTQ